MQQVIPAELYEQARVLEQELDAGSQPEHIIVSIALSRRRRRVGGRVESAQVGVARVQNPVPLVLVAVEGVPGVEVQLGRNELLGFGQIEGHETVEAELDRIGRKPVLLLAGGKAGRREQSEPDHLARQRKAELRRDPRVAETAAVERFEIIALELGRHLHDPVAHIERGGDFNVVAQAEGDPGPREKEIVRNRFGIGPAGAFVETAGKIEQSLVGPALVSRPERKDELPPADRAGLLNPQQSGGPIPGHLGLRRAACDKGCQNGRHP